MSRLRRLALLLMPALVLALAPPLLVRAASPKLVVLLVVDQMRADYIDDYEKQWTFGLRRLVDRGAWFRRAAYPYLETVTCPGHATISTGAFPATHGIILNNWWHRDVGKRLACADDARAPMLSYGKPVQGGHSAYRLAVPGFADQLRAQRPGSRVVTMSLKARSAIMLAGHGGDAVTWLDNSGTWVTSTAFAASPVPFVKRFVDERPIERDVGRVWERMLPAPAYRFEDAAAGERPPEGWAATFPHRIARADERSEEGMFELWRESPFSDDYLGQMARAAVDELKLGRGPETDFLAVSFSALDLVGHDFGPRSHEVQDVLVRLDATIGALLDHLDQAVGRDQYVVALTADHGVARIPEQAVAEGADSGRILSASVVERVERAVAQALGPGKYVARMEYTSFYFQPGVYEKLAARPEALKTVIETIASVPGVARVLRGEELGDRHSADPLVRAATLSHFPGRSGELVIVPKQGWYAMNPPQPFRPSDATTHGTLYPYDQRVPVILAGPGIRRGRYDQPITPADIAPTLGALTGVKLPDADGRALGAALAASAATRPAGPPDTKPLRASPQSPPQSPP